MFKCWLSLDSGNYVPEGTDSNNKEVQKVLTLNRETNYEVKKKNGDNIISIRNIGGGDYDKFGWFFGFSMT